MESKNSEGYDNKQAEGDLEKGTENNEILRNKSF